MKTCTLIRIVTLFVLSGILAGCLTGTTPTNTPRPIPQPATSQATAAPAERSPTIQETSAPAAPPPTVAVATTAPVSSSGQCKLREDSDLGVVLRAGPDTGFDMVTVVGRSDSLIPLAQTPAGDWLLLQAVDNAEGWAQTNLLACTFTVPLPAVTLLPSAAPSATVSATATEVKPVQRRVTATVVKLPEPPVPPPPLPRATPTKPPPARVTPTRPPLPQATPTRPPLPATVTPVNLSTAVPRP
jgi:hypothetical protein